MLGGSFADGAPGVIWGPFPLRRARLVIGLALLSLMAVVGALALLRDTLTCARSGALAGSCQWQGGARGDRRYAFPLASLRAVHIVRTQTSSKGQTTRWGAAALQIDDRELTMMRESEAVAEAHVDALHSFLNTPDMKDVHIATERPMTRLIPVAILGLIAFGLLDSVWAGRRRFRCTLDSFARQLRVQAEWPLGIAIGAPQIFEIRDPVEIEIDWGDTAADLFTPARMAGPRGGRLGVRLKDGSAVWLHEKRWPGYHVHIAAAEDLRQLLGCPLRTSAKANDIAAENEAARPVPAATWTRVSGKIATVWLGACCGSLLGIFIGALCALTIGGQKSSDSADGPFFFGGMICGIFGGVALAWRFMQRGDER